MTIKKAILRISKKKDSPIMSGDSVTVKDELFIFGQDVEIAEKTSETVKNLIIEILKRTNLDAKFAENEKFCFVFLNTRKVEETLTGAENIFTDIYNNPLVLSCITNFKKAINKK